MASKHHACTLFELEKKVEPALTALNRFIVAESFKHSSSRGSCCCVHENAVVHHENVDMTLGTVLATTLSPNDWWIYVWSAWAATQMMFFTIMLSMLVDLFTG